jgi:hypothetical protein
MVVAPIIAPTDRLLPQPNPPSSEERGEERGKERDLVLSFGRGEMEGTLSSPSAEGRWSGVFPATDPRSAWYQSVVTPWAVVGLGAQGETP